MTDRRLVEELEARVRALAVEAKVAVDRATSVDADLKSARATIVALQVTVDRCRCPDLRQELLDRGRALERLERRLGEVIAAKELVVVHECELLSVHGGSVPTERPAAALDASHAGPEVSPSPQAADDAQASGSASGAVELSPKELRRLLIVAEGMKITIGHVRQHGPWDSGNPDHVAGAEPMDELYNDLVRWARRDREHEETLHAMGLKE